MKLDFNLQITQKQGLTLTAQVQQAIKLLQMTNLEICEFVDEQFQDNPFVEEHAFSDTVAKTKPADSKNNEIDKTLEQTPYGNTENSNTGQQREPVRDGRGIQTAINCAKRE
jgi:RNA polymerase sigma-54 factor